MTNMICILCPKGCHLQVDEQNNYHVTGNGCERGVAYGKKELQNPTRTLTSTVRINGAPLPRLPVKTDKEIPKADLLPAMDLLNAVTLTAPVNLGDIILENILGTGANIVATRSLPALQNGGTGLG